LLAFPKAVERGVSQIPFAEGAASPYNSALTSVPAGVAQLVEQRIRNAKVTSSIPVIGTNCIRTAHTDLVE
jgi:hypothetical protein